MKNVFYSIWKVLSVLQIFKCLYFRFPLFSLPISHCFRDRSKINLKVCDIISCLNTTLFCLISREGKKYDIETFSLDTVLNKEYLYGKIIQKMCIKGYSQTLLTSANNPKEPLHARSFFKNKTFWTRIIKKPLKN